LFWSWKKRTTLDGAHGSRLVDEPDGEAYTFTPSLSGLAGDGQEDSQLAVLACAVASSHQAPAAEAAIIASSDSFNCKDKHANKLWPLSHKRRGSNAHHFSSEPGIAKALLRALPPVSLPSRRQVYQVDSRVALQAGPSTKSLR